MNTSRASYYYIITYIRSYYNIYYNTTAALDDLLIHFIIIDSRRFCLAHSMTREPSVVEFIVLIFLMWLIFFLPRRRVFFLFTYMYITLIKILKFRSTANVYDDHHCAATRLRPKSFMVCIHTHTITTRVYF